MCDPNLKRDHLNTSFASASACHRAIVREKERGSKEIWQLLLVEVGVVTVVASHLTIGVASSGAPTNGQPSKM